MDEHVFKRQRFRTFEILSTLSDPFNSRNETPTGLIHAAVEW